MAESRRRSKSSGGGSSSRSKSGSSRSSSGSSRKDSRDDRSPREIVREAVAQVQELIGRPVEAITGMERNGREWTVTVEVVELARIPNTTDVLGKYEVTLDQHGEVMSARRTRRYHRAEAGED
jgi:Gas vesicle synthesis protein GvpO